MITGHLSLQPLAAYYSGTVSIGYVCNSFEDRGGEYEIYVCLVFKQVAATRLKRLGTLTVVWTARY